MCLLGTVQVFATFIKYQLEFERVPETVLSNPFLEAKAVAATRLAEMQSQTEALSGQLQFRPDGVLEAWLGCEADSADFVDCAALPPRHG